MATTKDNRIANNLIAYVIEQNKDRDTANTTDDKSKSVKLFVPKIMSNISMGTKPQETPITVDNGMIQQSEPAFKFGSNIKEQNYIVAPPSRESGQEQPPLALGETCRLEFLADDPKKIKYSTGITNEKMRESDKTRTFIKDKTTLEGDDKEYSTTQDSAKQIYTILTNDGRGEVSKYEITINAKEGFIVLKDYKGQEIYLKTKEEHLYAKNKSGTIAEIKKDKVNVSAPSSITLTAPMIQINGNVEVAGGVHTSAYLLTDGPNVNHHSH